MRAPVLASKLLHFVSLTDGFFMLDAKLLKPQSAYRALLIIGTFEKRAPGLKTGMDFRGLVWKPVWKITFFGLKSGQVFRGGTLPPNIPRSTPPPAGGFCIINAWIMTVGPEVYEQSMIFGLPSYRGSRLKQGNKMPMLCPWTLLRLLKGFAALCCNPSPTQASGPS